jgi:hypothetical protein
MTGTNDGRWGAPDLRESGAATSVMARCLEEQAHAAPRTRAQRLFGRSPLHPEATSWYLGAIGELHVARLLARLDDSWTVLHSVPVGAGPSDIDHVLVSTRGVFTVNTKNHPGARVWATGTGFMVNGRVEGYIHASLHEASRASDLISASTGIRVPVTPVIVVVDPAVVTGSWPDAVVLPSSDLLRWLRRQPRAFPDDTVAGIVQAAARRGTWGNASAQPHAADPHRAEAVRRDFGRLRARVDGARMRRRLWAAAARAAIVAVVLAGALLLSRALPQFAAGLFGAAS